MFCNLGNGVINELVQPLVEGTGGSLAPVIDSTWAGVCLLCLAQVRKVYIV